MTGTVATASRHGVDALAPTVPSGRAAPAVPTAARDLVEFARDAGWLSLVQWCEAADGSPYLSVQPGLREPWHHVPSLKALRHVIDQHRRHPTERRGVPARATR